MNDAGKKEQSRIFKSAQPENVIEQISKRLSNIAVKYFPTEFQRRPDAFEDASSWKCTQVRDFLLYFGVTVLDGSIDAEYLSQFEILQASIRVLCKGGERASAEMIRKIERIFSWFLKSCLKKYGAEMLSHNFHLLTHLCENYERFGALDVFSTFCFENALNHLIKRKIKSGYEPLIQLANRNYE